MRISLLYMLFIKFNIYVLNYHTGSPSWVCAVIINFQVIKYLLSFISKVRTGIIK